MVFSIIVPVYNVEKYLDKCVKSILNQTYKEIEVILVDDGSPDNCPQMCDKYARNDSRVKVIHKKNGGLSEARNVGIEASTGEYVLFVDSDDWLVESACEQFNKYISKVGQIDICVGNLLNDDGTQYTPHTNAIVGKVYSGVNYFVKFHNGIIPCAVVPAYRREFLVNKSLRFMVGKYHEDNEFTPRAYLSADRVTFSNISHYVRFIREDSITQHSDKRKNLKDFIDIGNSLLLYSDTIKNKEACLLLKNDICNSYLSLFYVTDIFRYKNEMFKKYIDKRLVFKTAKSNYNRVRALLFTISPRLYLIFRKAK